MSITFKSFTILLILALSCVVGAQDENSISTAELMELSSISEVQYENAMSTAPIIEPPSVYIPASVNVEGNHNLLIGGISQSRILGENPALIEFADNNHAVYVPTYYSGNIPSDLLEVAKASGSKYIPTFENGLARTELQDQYYNTIFAYSGGTRTVVTAIDRQGVTAEKLVLISPMRATQSQDDYDRTIQRILNDGLVNKIEIWQSPQDQLPLVEFNQVRFEEGVDLDITVHSIDLDSEGISAHIELFSYVSGVYSGSPSVLAFDVSPRSLKCGDSLAITYTVLDNSGSGLKQVELWCRDETSDWQEIDRNALASENGPLSGTFAYSPLAPGKYWYGVHIIDNNDNWNDERNSNTNYQPVSFEPVEVEVIDQSSAQGSTYCDSEDAESWFERGVALYDQFEYTEAIDCFDEATQICPQYEEAWAKMGDAYLIGRFGFFSDNNPREAISCYDEALNINPKNATVWNNKGTAYNDLGQYDEAIQCYDEALNINPQYAEAWYGKGHSQYEQGNYDDALQSIEMAIALDPEIPVFWQVKGDILAALGSDEAQAAYDRGKELESIKEPTRKSDGAITYD